MTDEDHLSAWKRYDAYLFDIDGTLLTCADAVHYFGFCEALQLLAGKPLNLDGVSVHGNTDVGILRDALLLASVPERSWRPKLPTATRTMCEFVTSHENDFRITVLPGVRSLLDDLRTQNRVLGVATGNLEAIGRAKLKGGDLLERFAFGGYSDAFEFRRDVFCSALEKARTLAGQRATICVIGDTPEDIRAARANKLDVIAVATGTFSFKALQMERPDLCLSSLEDFSFSKPQ